MISAVAVVEPVKEAVVLANVMVAAAGEDEMAADVGVAMNASHMRITSTLLTPTGTLLLTNGNDWGLCARVSYSCETAVVVASGEATRVTKGATQ
jgi:hypothetical protein